MNCSRVFKTGLAVFICAFAMSAYAEPMAQLSIGSKIADFKTECLYENDLKQVVGARFRHEKTGFVLDLLRIQSVPQSYVWVNTPPPSDQGEPHTLEHLLLGKGTRGKYVGSLEEMNLGESSAFTMQVQTCYHYHTTAGTDIFFELFEAKLDAMLHPNYSDEEIRREVANMAIAENSDGSLRLDEKGTVYNEMKRGFESAWGEMGQEMDRLVWGVGHPYSYNSGGYPPAIRTMTPQNIRDFHASTHHLNNMGAIVTIPDQVELKDCLTRFSAMFKRLEPNGKKAQDPATFEARLPKAMSAEAGTIKRVAFPHANVNQPGMVTMAWPPVRHIDARQETLLRLFIENFGSGQTSNLYQMFINSETKKVDVGVDWIWSSVSDFTGMPVSVILNNVNTAATEPAMLDFLRKAIMNELTRIASWPDGSPELKEFNDRIKNKIIEQRRQYRVFLNTPPSFGRRGVGSGWFDHLKRVQRSGGDRRSLTLSDELNFADSLLSGSTNVWRVYLDAWQLTNTQPYVVGTHADPQVLAKEETELKDRISAFTDNLKQKYKATSDSLALVSFKKSYDSLTTQIDSIALTIKTPTFVSNPPLTLDDYLQFKTTTLPGGGALVSSEFSNYSGGAFGLAFNAAVIPDSLLMYVSMLPSLITQIGVLKGDTPVSFSDMTEQLRRDILSLDAYFSTNHRTERVELIVRASGSDSVELAKGLNWLETALFNPDLRPENLTRIQDVVALSLSGSRDRMEGGEEGWVNEPTNAYWRQTNPLLLSTNCFLTEAHHLQRLKWQLKESGRPRLDEEFTFFMTELAKYPAMADRSLLKNMLEALMGTAKEVKVRGGAAKVLLDAMITMQPETIKNIAEAAKDLNRCLDDIPDGSIAADWDYLCKQILADYKMPAKEALVRLGNTLALVRHADNVRGFTIASPEATPFVTASLGAIADKLNKAASVTPTHAHTPVVVSRVQSRLGTDATPVFVALVNENTRSGVHYNTAQLANNADSDPAKLLDFLAGRVYGGHGSHTIFTQTIGAGLAYSNGVRANEDNGRLWYYAERSPDLAQTMDFVVKAVKAGPKDASLGDYAVAQAFLSSRAADDYNYRGEAMAENIVDGITPDAVKRYRSGMLELRKAPGFYDSLYTRKERVHGRVLPGYGNPAAQDMKDFDAVFFVIGPEKQLSTYEEYLKQVEGADTKLYRLYPRDYWVVGSAK